MENIISGLLNTALDAASSLVNKDHRSSSSSPPRASEDNNSGEPSFIDRSTWAEIVSGPGEQPAHNSNRKDQPHSQHSWRPHESNQAHQQSSSSESSFKHQVPGYDLEKSDGWKKVGGSGLHPSHQHPSPDHYYKVPDDQWHEYKKPAHKQGYASPVNSSVDTQPTQEELRDISAACNRLWELDLNRLTPGQHYEINCGEGKKVYEKEDMATNSLFRHVSKDVFRKPTYARFYALLDNYNAKQGVKENVTEEERQEEVAFIEEISRTAPIQYLFKYLASQGIVSQSAQEFKEHLHSLWFGLYGRGGSHGSSSAFEHVFIGEIKSGRENEVSGFHNWIKFYVEEAAGRVDYQGYILPRRRNHGMPDAHSQCLSIQFTWNGVKKPVSSTFVGVSPEFEVALYTLCFYGGQEDNYVELGPYSVNIKCYQMGRDKLGSAFPIAQD